MIKVKDYELISLHLLYMWICTDCIMIAVQGPDLGTHRNTGDLLTADGTCYFNIIS